MGIGASLSSDVQTPQAKLTQVDPAKSSHSIDDVIKYGMETLDEEIEEVIKATQQW